MPIPPTQPYPLQIYFGPYTWLVKSGFVLAEGQQFQASIIAADGSAFTMIFNGGHDFENKLVGCGGVTQGEPTFQAPVGAEVFDALSQLKWISLGWEGGAPADGLDVPFEGAITASNFLGWIAFCPCIAATTAIPGSGATSGGYLFDTFGGGGGLVVTECCPQGLPTTLYLSTSNACASVLNGNFVLSWNGEYEIWTSPAINSPDGTALFYVLRCTNGTFELSITPAYQSWAHVVSGYEALYLAASVSCSPLDIIGNTTPDVWDMNNVCPSGPQTLTWFVTD